jgi:hypothetical protein
VITPAVVMRPILLEPGSVNHSAPSGPETIPRGKLPAVGTGNSVIVCAMAASAIPSPLVFERAELGEAADLDIGL